MDTIHDKRQEVFGIISIFYLILIHFYLNPFIDFFVLCYSQYRGCKQSLVQSSQENILGPLLEKVNSILEVAMLQLLKNLIVYLWAELKYRKDGMALISAYHRLIFDVKFLLLFQLMPYVY